MHYINLYYIYKFLSGSFSDSLECFLNSQITKWEHKNHRIKGQDIYSWFCHYFQYILKNICLERDICYFNLFTVFIIY